MLMRFKDLILSADEVRSVKAYKMTHTDQLQVTIHFKDGECEQLQCSREELEEFYDRLLSDPLEGFLMSIDPAPVA